MKTVSVTVTYKMPGDDTCNNGKDMCRFHVKTRREQVCSLYNELLMTCGLETFKCKECMNTMAYGNGTVEEASTEAKEVVNLIVDHFVDYYNYLRKAGAPEELALSLAIKEAKGEKL